MPVHFLLTNGSSLLWIDEDVGFKWIDYSRKIIVSGKAHYYVEDYVNKRNCSTWAFQNPHVVAEKPLNPQRVTVWCGSWKDCILGLYFLENEAWNNVTVNIGRYRDMKTDFLWSHLDDLDMPWFQRHDRQCTAKMCWKSGLLPRQPWRQFESIYYSNNRKTYPFQKSRIHWKVLNDVVSVAISKRNRQMAHQSDPKQVFVSYPRRTELITVLYSLAKNLNWFSFRIDSPRKIAKLLELQGVTWKVCRRIPVSKL